MERAFRYFADRLGRKENILQVSLSDESRSILKKALRRPNPYLSEFIFFGLGKNGFVDTVIVNDGEIYPGIELKQVSTHVHASTSDSNDYNELVKKLSDSGRSEELLILGHTHPTGSVELNGQTLVIDPGEYLLIPSAGSKSEGGLIAYDLKAAAEIAFAFDDPPHFAIMAETMSGPKLRIYKTIDLANVKKYADIKHAAQITITL